jgi:hypothetical protein
MRNHPFGLPEDASRETEPANRIGNEERAQIQSACDRAARLIVRNDRALLRARRLLQSLESARTAAGKDR